MRDKWNNGNGWGGEHRRPRGESLKDHIRSDLERLGKVAQASETLARRLESTCHADLPLKRLLDDAQRRGAVRESFEGDTHLLANERGVQAEGRISPLA